MASEAAGCCNALPRSARGTSKMLQLERGFPPRPAYPRGAYTPCATAQSRRHSIDGVSTLEVSKIAGTSLAMSEKHYGHLVQDTMRERFTKVQMV